MGKRLKKCSTSTNVDSTTEPSQNESDDLEPQVIVKKQKKVEEYDCIYENEDAYRNNNRTILVRGLDCSLSVDDIESALRKHFGSCGKISRVFIPTECKTGSRLGIAYIDVISDDENKKTLLLDGSYLGSMKLEVMLARGRYKSVLYPNFKGCERCIIVRRERFYSWCGRVQPRTPELDRIVAELLKEAEARKAEAKNHI